MTGDMINTKLDYLPSNTTLRMEYAERSSSYELPEHLEQALEKDYIMHSQNYTDALFKQIEFIYLITPNISSDDMLQYVASERRRVNK